MIVTVHHRTVTLWHGDYPIRWDVVRFVPQPREVRELPSGHLLESSASAPIAIKVPVGSVLIGELLKPTPGSPGLDATSVFHLARKQRFGYKFAEPKISE